MHNYFSLSGQDVSVNYKLPRAVILLLVVLLPKVSVLAGSARIYRANCIFGLLAEAKYWLSAIFEPLLFGRQLQY